MSDKELDELERALQIYSEYEAGTATDPISFAQALKLASDEAVAQVPLVASAPEPIEGAIAAQAQTQEEPGLGTESAAVVAVEDIPQPMPDETSQESVEPAGQVLPESEELTNERWRDNPYGHTPVHPGWIADGFYKVGQTVFWGVPRAFTEIGASLLKLGMDFGTKVWEGVDRMTAEGIPVFDTQRSPLLKADSLSADEFEYIKSLGGLLPRDVTGTGAQDTLERVGSRLIVIAFLKAKLAGTAFGHALGAAATASTKKHAALKLLEYCIVGGGASALLENDKAIFADGFLKFLGQKPLDEQGPIAKRAIKFADDLLMSVITDVGLRALDTSWTLLRSMLTDGDLAHTPRAIVNTLALVAPTTKDTAGIKLAAVKELVRKSSGEFDIMFSPELIQMHSKMIAKSEVLKELHDNNPALKSTLELLQLDGVRKCDKLILEGPSAILPLDAKAIAKALPTEAGAPVEAIVKPLPELVKGSLRKIRGKDVQMWSLVSDDGTTREFMSKEQANVALESLKAATASDGPRIIQGIPVNRMGQLMPTWEIHGLPDGIKRFTSKAKAEAALENLLSKEVTPVLTKESDELLKLNKLIEEFETKAATAESPQLQKIYTMRLQDMQAKRDFLLEQQPGLTQEAVVPLEKPLAKPLEIAEQAVRELQEAAVSTGRADAPEVVEAMKKLNPEDIVKRVEALEKQVQGVGLPKDVTLDQAGPLKRKVSEYAPKADDPAIVLYRNKRAAALGFPENTCLVTSGRDQTTRVMVAAKDKVEAAVINQVLPLLRKREPMPETVLNELKRHVREDLGSSADVDEIISRFSRAVSADNTKALLPRPKHPKEQLWAPTGHFGYQKTTGEYKWLQKDYLQPVVKKAETIEAVIRTTGKKIGPMSRNDAGGVAIRDILEFGWGYAGPILKNPIGQTATLAAVNEVLGLGIPYSSLPLVLGASIATKMVYNAVTDRLGRMGVEEVTDLIRVFSKTGADNLGIVKPFLDALETNTPLKSASPKMEQFLKGFTEGTIKGNVELIDTLRKSISRNLQPSNTGYAGGILIKALDAVKAEDVLKGNLPGLDEALVDPQALYSRTGLPAAAEQLFLRLSKERDISILLPDRGSIANEWASFVKKTPVSEQTLEHFRSLMPTGTDPMNTHKYIMAVHQMLESNSRALLQKSLDKEPSDFVRALSGYQQVQEYFRDPLGFVDSPRVQQLFDQQQINDLCSVIPRDVVESSQPLKEFLGYTDYMRHCLKLSNKQALYRDTVERLLKTVTYQPGMSDLVLRMMFEGMFSSPALTSKVLPGISGQLGIEAAGKAITGAYGRVAGDDLQVAASNAFLKGLWDNLGKNLEVAKHTLLTGDVIFDPHGLKKIPVGEALVNMSSYTGGRSTIPMWQSFFNSFTRALGATPTSALGALNTFISRCAYTAKLSELVEVEALTNPVFKQQGLSVADAKKLIYDSPEYIGKLSLEAGDFGRATAFLSAGSISKRGVMTTVHPAATVLGAADRVMNLPVLGYLTKLLMPVWRTPIVARFVGQMRNSPWAIMYESIAGSDFLKALVNPDKYFEGMPEELKKKAVLNMHEVGGRIIAGTLIGGMIHGAFRSLGFRIISRDPKRDVGLKKSGAEPGDYIRESDGMVIGNKYHPNLVPLTYGWALLDEGLSGELVREGDHYESTSHSVLLGHLFYSLEQPEAKQILERIERITAGDAPADAEELLDILDTLVSRGGARMEPAFFRRMQEYDAGARMSRGVVRTDRFGDPLDYLTEIGSNRTSVYKPEQPVFQLKRDMLNSGIDIRGHTREAMVLDGKQVFLDLEDTRKLRKFMGEYLGNPKQVNRLRDFLKSAKNKEQRFSRAQEILSAARTHAIGKMQFNPKAIKALREKYIK